MSNFKVGDRVRIVGSGLHEGNRGVIVVDDEATNGLRYIVRFDRPSPQTGDDSYTWASAKDLRRLIKRKRANVAAPDRVMVAAQLMPYAMARIGEIGHAQSQNEYSRIVREFALHEADALIAEGAK